MWNINNEELSNYLVNGESSQKLWKRFNIVNVIFFLTKKLSKLKNFLIKKQSFQKYS